MFTPQINDHNHHVTFKISLDTQTKLPDQKYTTSNHHVTFKVSLDTQTKLPAKQYTNSCGSRLVPTLCSAL